MKFQEGMTLRAKLSFDHYNADCKLSDESSILIKAKDPKFLIANILGIANVQVPDIIEINFYLDETYLGYTKIHKKDFNYHKNLQEDFKELEMQFIEKLQLKLDFFNSLN